MNQVTTIGLDIAKSIFQVHGVDAAGQSVLRQRLSRSRVLEFFGKLPRCLIGLEACASSHYWARELIKLGHEVKLMPAQYVKPYVKRGKNDAADAEAICEAVARPTMRFVGVKTTEQQSVMMLHRVRRILTRQRTQLSNALRSHLAEFGIRPHGREGLDRLLKIVADTDDGRVMVGAMAVIRYAQRNCTRRPWLVQLTGGGYRARQQDRPNGVGADDSGERYRDPRVIQAGCVDRIRNAFGNPCTPASPRLSAIRPKIAIRRGCAKTRREMAVQSEDFRDFSRSARRWTANFVGGVP